MNAGQVGQTMAARNNRHLLSWRFRSHSERLILQVCLAGAICFLAGCEHGVSCQDEGRDDDGWIHDFGIVEAGTTQCHVFSLRNTSGRNVSFEQFQSSCSCSGLTINKKRLRPGEEFEITVHFHAGHKTYDTAPTIVGFFGGDERWTVVLRLMAKVRQAVALSASELRWNSAGVGEFADGVFLVRNYSKKKWSDVSFAVSESWLSLRAEPVPADEGALQTWKCTARPLPGTLSAGDHLTSITLTPDGADTEVTLPVRVSLQEPVILMPSRIFHIRDPDRVPRTVDLSFVFCTETVPTSRKAFLVSSTLGNAVWPEIVQENGGKWVLRCHISGTGSVIRDQLRVDIPSANASIMVPVFVSGQDAGDAE